ncbi:MAG: hypothetical protein KF723_14500 [Rhizobiaceae bacterium]|nr:hypothetical protein [Rhizobiaceae bacterium]
MVVRVPLASDYEGGLRTLRALEHWLAEHHRPVALFRADGRPRSDVVCVAVPEDRPEQALAWRTFCGELGVARGMVQWRTAALPPVPSEPPFSMDFDE